MSHITVEEWSVLAQRLESHHSIFYKMWSAGKPVFSEQVDTAAVEFDKVGNCLRLCFNQRFWHSMDEDGRLFVIAHEMLHVILNHGKRCAEVPAAKRVAANICMDVVVNHLLVNGFGFDRKSAEDSVRKASKSESESPLCWVDTVFSGMILPDDECFEFYYSKYLKSFGDGNSPMAALPNNGCLDDHSRLPSCDMDSLMEGIASEMTKEELQSIFGVVKKHRPNEFAGIGQGMWAAASERRVSRRRRWESVIKKWERAASREDYGLGEQWTRRGRRHCSLSDSIFLPSEVDAVQVLRDEKSVEVLFFMDTSGSCWDLRDRFMSAAKSLDKRRFETRLFCFDTSAVEITERSGRVYGGGGTSFRAVAMKVEECCKGRRHPHVFVLTDGYGDAFSAERPERWHWFVTRGGTVSYIDDRCHVHRLEDYD